MVVVVVVVVFGHEERVKNVPCCNTLPIVSGFICVNLNDEDTAEWR